MMKSNGRWCDKDGVYGVDDDDDLDSFHKSNNLWNFLGSILFSKKIHLVLVYWSVICKFVYQTPYMERFKFISAISPPHQLSMTYFGASHFHTWIRINVCIFLCIVYVNEICIKYLGLSCKLMISRYEHDTQDRLWEIFVYF